MEKESKVTGRKTGGNGVTLVNQRREGGGVEEKGKMANVF